MKNDILTIYESSRTIFSTNEIALMLNESNRNNLKSRLNYFVKKNYLQNLRKGIYSKNNDYNIYELGNKIYAPSYVSLDTILARNGIIFQYDSRIFLSSYLSREINVNNQTYIYKKIKDSILFSKEGIEYKDNYYQAILERAFLDKIYLNPNFYFDNLNNINWEKAFTLSKIYQNKKVIQSLELIFKNFKNAK